MLRSGARKPFTPWNKDIAGPGVDALNGLQDPNRADETDEERWAQFSPDDQAWLFSEAARLNAILKSGSDR